jgi:hypothetical protein
VTEEAGSVVGLASLIAWPLIASIVAAILRLERGQPRAIVFYVLVAVTAGGVGLILDLRLVASGEASAVGASIIYIGLAFTPPGVAAARQSGPANSSSWYDVGRRAVVAYGVLCVSAPAALIVGFFVGVNTCRGACL